ATIGAEAVGAVPLLAIPVVQARGIHALAAALASPAAGMYLDRHPVADIELVDRRPELHHGAHIFVTRGEALMERQVAVDHRRYAVPDDLDIGGADGDRVDTDQHFRRSWLRHRFFHQRKFFRAAEHPGPHRLRDRVFVAAPRR